MKSENLLLANRMRINALYIYIFNSILKLIFYYIVLINN